MWQFLPLYCEQAGILSEEGLAALKAYDLKTSDIYNHVKNFVALVQSDNQVKIDTYYNYLLDTTVRSLLKTMLGQKPVVGEEVGDTVNLTLSVAPDDMGKVIGRGGRIAKAIRQVMKVAANNCGKRVTVDIR